MTNPSNKCQCGINQDRDTGEVITCKREPAVTVTVSGHSFSTTIQACGECREKLATKYRVVIREA